MNVTDSTPDLTAAEQIVLIKARLYDLHAAIHFEVPAKYQTLRAHLDRNREALKTQEEAERAALEREHTALLNKLNHVMKS